MSSTHFFVKLVLAAPASFFSAAWASQVAATASDSHFLMKLVLAAPDSFFSLAAASHLPSAAWEDRARAVRSAEHRRRVFFMGFSRQWGLPIETPATGTGKFAGKGH